MASKVLELLKRRPLLVSLVSNTLKTAGADIFTQKFVEQKETLDTKRLAVFSTFGFAYLGGWQYLLFNKCFVRLETFLAVKNIGTITKSTILTGLDMCVHTPLVYFPSFYLIKGCIDNKNASCSMKDYKANFKHDMLSMWQVWIPAQLVNFSLVPLHLRMPYVTCVSFAWTVILSMMRGDHKHKNEQ
jgi:protein Mpv17